MADQWKSAFKTIYGKSPGKADYTLAPGNKEAAKAKQEADEEEKKGRNLFAPTRLKRPAQFSPIKQVVKRRAIQPIQEEKEEKPVAVAVRESPRKKLIPTQSSASSPFKKVLFAPISGDICFKSPSKPMNRGSPKKSLADGLNPSPRKPLVRRKLMISCADALYETKSPMKNTDEVKNQNKIPFEELQAENAEAMKDMRPKVYRKKTDTNFLKLNMKKGYHAKGKLTGEQKRKFKKKANYKKFKAGQ